MIEAISRLGLHTTKNTCSSAKLSCITKVFKKLIQLKLTISRLHKPFQSITKNDQHLTNQLFTLTITYQNIKINTNFINTTTILNTQKLLEFRHD